MESLKDTSENGLKRWARIVADTKRTDQMKEASRWRRAKRPKYRLENGLEKKRSWRKRTKENARLMRWRRNSHNVENGLCY